MIMSPLLDPLEDDQATLLSVVWAPFRDHIRWPTFSYVDFHMRKRELSALSVMGGLPTIGRTYGGYRAVMPLVARGPASDSDPVWLTMAGMYHIADERATAISDALLIYMRRMTSAREALGTSPFSVPNINVDLRQTLIEHGADLEILPWASLVAGSESPFMRVSRTATGPNVSGTLGVLREANFSTIEEYLMAITAVTTPQQPPAVPAYRDPRALLRTIDDLEITTELILGQSLISRPAMGRSALLSQEAQSHSDLQSCLSALGQVIGALQVPGNNPSHPTGRLKAWLVKTLPRLDQAGQTRIQDAIELLDAVRRIRNSGQHPKPAQQLIADHDLLGLPFPIQDPASAWDIIRAQMDIAFGSLQEEIYAAR